MSRHLVTISIIAGLIGGCATSFAPDEKATSLTSGPVAGAERDEEDLRVQQMFVRGLTRAMTGDHQQAVFLFEQALQIDPNQPAILHALAESHTKLGEAGEALYYARGARNLDPSNRAYLLNVVSLQRETGDPASALAEVERWLTVYPDDRTVRFVSAQLLSDLDRPEDALQTFREVLNQESDNLQALHHILDIYSAEGNVEGIVLTLGDMLEIDPGNVELLRRLAEVQISSRDTVGAIRTLELVVERDPDDSTALRSLADLYRRSGQSAHGSPDPVERGDAASEPARLALASDLFARAATDPQAALDAKSLLSQLLEEGNRSAEAMFMLGALYAEDGRIGEAAELLAAGLESDPRHPELWAQSADYFLKSGSAERSAAMAQEGLMLFPGQLPLLTVAADAALAAGDYESAIQSAETILRLVDPGPEARHARAQAHEVKGDAYLQLGSVTEARANWSLALKENPDLNSAREKMDANP